MKTKVITYILMCVAVLLCSLVPVFARAEAKQLPKLIMFHSPTCHRCAETKAEIMPRIEAEFKDKISIEYRDISDIENYKFLISLQQKHGAIAETTLPVFYFQGHFLSGAHEIENNLKNMLSASEPSSAISVSGVPEVDLIERFRAFKPLAVLGAGLIDGINPCAFTVIVFFISFLAVQGYRRRKLVFIGLSFIVAVFLTYLLIGLGLFEFLYRLRAFWLAARIINASIGILSIILGVFCIYDFLKFRQTKDTQGLILQLPPAVKNQIHKVIGLHYRVDKRLGAPAAQKNILKLVISAFVTGFIVSILEAVCTGQVYLPTISFVLKTTHLKLHAAAYLVLYNLMFIAPLFAVFLFALLGATSGNFANFLKKYLGTIKIIMALLFFSLGIYLIWRG